MKNKINLNKEKIKFWKWRWKRDYRKILLMVAIFILLVYFGFYLKYESFDPNQTTKNLSSIFNLLVLTETLIVYIWLGKEAFDQKNILNKTIEETRSSNNYQMMPYLRLQFNPYKENILQIVNDGLGIAIDVIFKKIIFKKDNVSFVIKKRPLIKQLTNVSVRELALNNRFKNLEYGEITEFLRDRLKNNFEIIANYQDIKNNKYEVKFVSDETYNDYFKIEYQKKLS